MLSIVLLESTEKETRSGAKSKERKLLEPTVGHCLQDLSSNLAGNNICLTVHVLRLIRFVGRLQMKIPGERNAEIEEKD